jgi:hypothetical protein
LITAVRRIAEGTVGFQSLPFWFSRTRTPGPVVAHTRLTSQRYSNSYSKLRFHQVFVMLCSCVIGTNCTIFCRND